MKKINVFECDYCNKTYKDKNSCRRHEKGCFYNPETHSCATCIWCSLSIFNDYPRQCFVGELQVNPEGKKQILKTNCTKWLDKSLAEDIELLENKDGILDQLVAGNPKFFMTLVNLMRKERQRMKDELSMEYLDDFPPFF